MVETRAHFLDELKQLEEQALGGLDLVAEQLDRTLEAVQHQDIELAAMVIGDDDRIDGRYLEVHQGVLSLLARQAPVATDLRLIVSSWRTRSSASPTSRRENAAWDCSTCERACRPIAAIFPSSRWSDGGSWPASGRSFAMFTH